MKPIRSRLAATGLALLCAGSALVAVAPEAQAASPCPGTRVGKYQLYAGGEVPDHFRHGHIEVWYSSANGGTNCVLVYDDAPGKHWMTVGVMIPKAGAKIHTDSGRFYTYAGPVKVTKTKGTCISFYAEVMNGGISYRQAINRVHCG